jgi:hypothetical protein
VIFSEARKYSANTRKLGAKLDSQGPLRDVITTLQVRIESRRVEHASSLNLQRRIHVTLAQKQRSSRAIHVKLCRDLLSFTQRLPCTVRNFLARQQTYSREHTRERKTQIVLVRASGNVGYQIDNGSNRTCHAFTNTRSLTRASCGLPHVTTPASAVKCYTLV